MGATVSPRGLAGLASQFTSQQLLCFGAGLLYATVAVAMGFINKAVLMDYRFSNTILMLQMAASAVICYALRWAGVLFFRPLEWRTARQLLPLVFFYNANVAFALGGLRTLNVPMYNVLKRLTPVIVLTAKIVTTGKLPAVQVALSVLTTVAGCVVAGLGDFSFDPTGYFFALCSCMLQATYLLLVERTGGEKGLTSTELLLYNSVLSFPPLVLLVWLTGEAQLSIADLWTLENHSPWFLTNLFVSSVMGVLLNYTLFLCTLVNSALSTTIIGVMKGVASTLLGFVLLGGVEPHFLNCLGIGINMVGGMWYTVAKFRGRKGRGHRESLPAGKSEESPTLPRFRPSLGSPATSLANFDPYLPKVATSPIKLSSDRQRDFQSELLLAETLSSPGLQKTAAGHYHDGSMHEDGSTRPLVLTSTPKFVERVPINL